MRMAKTLQLWTCAAKYVSVVPPSFVRITTIPKPMRKLGMKKGIFTLKISHDATAKARSGTLSIAKR